MIAKDTLEASARWGVERIQSIILRTDQGSKQSQISYSSQSLTAIILHLPSALSSQSDARSSSSLLSSPLSKSNLVLWLLSAVCSVIFRLSPTPSSSIYRRFMEDVNQQYIIPPKSSILGVVNPTALLSTAPHIDNKIFKRMIGKVNKSERGCRSEEKRRSVGQEDSRRSKMESMKLRFRNITRQISQIKKQNDSDINQLNNLIHSSDQLQLMASQSLEKAKMILSQSKIDRKRVTSPPFHQVKHAQPQETSEFSPQLPVKMQGKSSQPYSASGKKKNRFSKHSAHRTKTEETSESEVPRRNTRIQRINETELFQQSSMVRQQCIKEQPEQQSLIRSSTKFPTKQSKAETFKANPNTSTKFNSSISMRNSLKKSQNKSQDASTSKRKTESIYPYIAIILFSILLLLSLRE